MQTIRKRIFSFLLASISVLGTAAAAPCAPASAAVSATTVKQAYLAYLLTNEEALSQKVVQPADTAEKSPAQIAAKDLNGDGLPELLISLGNSDQIYTYLNGKVTLVSKTSGTQTFRYCSAKKLICKYNHTSASVFRDTYYTLKNGKLKEKYQLSAKKVNGKTVYYLNGKTITAKKYKSFQKTYSSAKISTTGLDYRNAIGLLSPGFSRTNYTVNAGEYVELDLFHTGKQTVTYATKKKSVANFATEDDRANGIVTGKASGTAIITATVGNKTYQCTVTVIEGTPLTGEPKELKMGETYTEDLNGDGEKETIQWNCSINAKKATCKLDLWVDGTKFTHSDLELPQDFTSATEYMSIYLTDSDTSDSQKELYIEAYGASDWVTCSRFYTYDGTTMIKYAEPPKDHEYGRYTYQGVTPDGNFRYKIDTPFFDENFGMYYAYADFTLPSGKSTYLSMSGSQCYITNSARYTPLEKLSAKDTIEGTKTTVSFAPGEPCFVDSIIKKDGSLYLQLSNRAGKTGWLKLPNRQIFYESQRNLWG